MKMKTILFAALFLTVFCSMESFQVNDTNVEKSKILSRRKRFLVFPEGSSFQLVFCSTYEMVFTIGDIFLWGNTAALAWELPQDPYSPFNHHADPLHRRQDTKMIYYTSETGKILYKRPYERKFIVNPAFAKRSADDKKPERIRIERKQMHALQSRREFLNNAAGARFHRSGRAALYSKIEALMTGLGADGRQCVLRSLCAVGQARRGPQGTFLHEILRATFTLPEGPSGEELLEYDAAYSAETPCDELYPDCSEPIRQPTVKV